MTFADLNQGDQVTLTVYAGEEQMVFKSTILNIVDNCVVIEPILVEGAILNFLKDMKIEFMAVHSGETPIFWKSVKVEVKLFHDRNVHVISSGLPGVKLNRRNYFRVYIGKNVKMNGGKDGPMNVMLKDISGSGFAVMLDKKSTLELHKKISVEYSDQSLQKYFELSGRPIRTEVTDSYNVYGCVLDRHNPDLDSYLNQKQMENRPNNRIKF